MTFDYGVYRDNIYITRLEAKNKKDALMKASKYFVGNIIIKRIYNSSEEIKLWKI